MYSETLSEGLRLLQATIEKLPLARGYSALARVQQANGDWADALTSFAQGEAWFLQMQIPEAPALAWLVAQRARLWIRQGNLPAAKQWAAQYQAEEDVELSFVQRLTCVRLWLAQTNQNENPALFGDAMQILETVRSEAEVGEWTGYIIESLLLQALTLYAQNDSAGATISLEQALSLAEPGGYLRLFLDEDQPMRFLILDFGLWIAQQAPSEQTVRLSIFVNKLIAGFGNERIEDEPLVFEQPSIQNPKLPSRTSVVEPSKIQNLVESLSYRELEVLQLVAAGLSNGEIAAKLIVSTSTVKTHINHLFGKLGVQSRTQAVARARELGLLTN